MDGMSEKQRALECIAAMPDSATLAEVIDRLFLLHKIKKGIAQADAGQCVSHTSVVEELELLWSKEQCC